MINSIQTTQQLQYTSPRLSEALVAHVPLSSHQPSGVGLLVLSGHTEDSFMLPYEPTPKPLWSALKALYQGKFSTWVSYSMEEGLKVEGEALTAREPKAPQAEGHFMSLALEAQREVSAELNVSGRHQHEPHQALMEIDELLSEREGVLCLIKGVGGWEPISAERPDVLRALRAWPERCVRSGSVVIFADHSPSASLCRLYAGLPHSSQATLRAPCEQELRCWLVSQELEQRLTFDPTLTQELTAQLARSSAAARVGLKTLSVTLKGPLDEAWLAQSGARAFDPKRVDVSALEAWLKSSLIGQERAKRRVVSAAKEMKYFGGKARRQPLMRALFTGPPGVGKTELARGLSEHLYGQESPLLINCTELQQEHEVAKLLGAPPGYVGYGTPGYLEQFIQARGAGVIIFDELEKAHPSVHQALMGVLEEGVLQSPSGGRVMFDRSVIIGTTNAGHRQVIEALKRSPELSREEVSALYERGVSACFDGPLLRRFDLKVTFDVLNEGELFEVAELSMRRAVEAHAPSGLEVRWSEGWLRSLMASCDLSLGAGELKTVVEQAFKQSLIREYYERDERSTSLFLEEARDV